MLLLCVSVPRIVLVLTGNSKMLVNHSPLEYADFPAALFIIAYILTVLRSGYKTEAELEAEEAEKAEEGAETEGEEEPKEETEEPAELSETDKKESSENKIPFDRSQLIDELKD